MAMVLPIRSSGFSILLPLRTTSASAALICAETMKATIGRPREVAAANGLEPRLPSCTSPEAMAVITSAPLLKRRQSSFSPMAFS
ncbi:hypothetical protein D3C81_1770130 [compost metagenome]